MRLFVFLCCLVVLCSQTFAKWNGGSSYIGIEVSTWETRINDWKVNTADFNIVLDGGKKIYKNLYLSADVFSLHSIPDKIDTGHSDIRVSGINSLISLCFAPYIIFQGDDHKVDDDALGKIFFRTLFLLNPTVEYYFWKGRVPVSVGAGYKTDWFIFSPGKKFYFRPHADLNVNLAILRVSASYAYVVTNTYDLKRGPRIYLKVALGGTDRE